jgi:O-methyltransferase
MSAPSIDTLLKQYPLISGQVTQEELRVILRELATAVEQGIEGAVVEFGCYKGTTSLFIRRLLNSYGDSRAFHAYDSFEGLPPKHQHDQSAAGVDFKAGELAASKKQFLHEFQKAGLRPPVTHKAWFNKLSEDDVPEQITFAFLDGDFYDSILDSLRLVHSRMNSGSRIVIDDYNREALPGVRRAVQDFFQGKPLRVRTKGRLGIIEL